MKHVYLDSHTDECISFTKRLSESKDDFLKSWIVCQCQPKEFLFYHNTKFYLIEYSSCIEGYDAYSFFISILNQAIGQVKAFKIWDVEKSYRVNDDLKKQRLHGIRTRRFLNEFNYCYTDASYREYAIITKTPFMQHIINNDGMIDSFKDAKKYLEENNREYLVRELENLYSLNRTFVEDIEVIRSIDEVIKQINKK